MITLLTLIIIALKSYAVRTTYNAQQIISSVVNQDKITYHSNDNALNFLTTTDGPYKIISVIGQARKGKSTTLNSIISTLIDQNVSPFNKSDDIDPCTQGIWMYIIPKCSCNVNEDKCVKSTDNEDIYCLNSDYTFIFLDVQGSDTAENEMALRYASIVTLLSSKIFLFIHESIYLHDIRYIDNIETFRKELNRQNIDVSFNDIDLGIIIREPLGDLVKGKLEDKINELFEKILSGVNLNDDSVLLSRTLPVLAVDNIKRDQLYKKSIQELADFILDDMNYHKSTNKVTIELLSAQKIIEFVHLMIAAMNDNKDLNAICFACFFSLIIDWNEWGEWSECTEKCGGGIEERKRTCNTGRDKDCMKFRHGSASHQQKCNEFACELLKWGDWHPWSECSEACDGGTQERFRECKTGDAKHCEKEFGGEQIEERNCNTHSCYNFLCTLFGLFCWLW